MRQPRLRTPPTFSLSMLDVLCCGLGAVLMLMFLNTWDARKQATDLAAERLRVSETANLLRSTQKELEAERGILSQTMAKLRYVETSLTNTGEKLRDVQAALAATEKSRKLLESELTAKKLEAEGLRGKLKQTEADLALRTNELTKTRQEHELLQARHLALEKEAKRLEGALAASQEDATKLRQRLFAVNVERIAVLASLIARDIDLADKQRLVASLHGKVEITQKQLTEAEQLARLIPGLRDELQSLLKKLRSTELLLADANAIASMAPTLRLELDTATKLAAATAIELARLRKEAEAAGLKLREAEKSQAAFTLEADQLKKLLAEQRLTLDMLKERLTLSEARFAGINLGGKRVVILVDTSGSMASVDAKTTDPTKWPEVCETVAAILRSMPDVEKYQVILFADEPRFLLGKPGEWLDVPDRRKTAQEVESALRKVTPEGGTNLYAAFETAFRFKPQGLDAIVLFSDGLPNAGPGVPVGTTLDAAAKETALGKHVRDTIRGRWNAGPSRVRVHSVGFYYESTTLGQFLWSLARENNGSFVGMSKP